jgi:hypothetical protein
MKLKFNYQNLFKDKIKGYVKNEIHADNYFKK